MKMNRLRIAVAVLLTLVLSTQCKTKRGLNMKQDKRNVMAAIESMTEAFHKGDLVKTMASYDDEKVVVFEPTKPISDDSNLRKMFETSFKLKPKFKYNGHEVFVSGDIALHISPWKMTGKAPNGETVSQSGLSVAVLTRQPDNSWRIKIDNPHGQRLLVK